MSYFSFRLAEISGFNLGNTALEIPALTVVVELASLNMLVYFGTLVVFDKLGTLKILYS